MEERSGEPYEAGVGISHIKGVYQEPVAGAYSGRKVVGGNPEHAHGQTHPRGSSLN